MFLVVDIPGRCAEKDDLDGHPRSPSSCSSFSGSGYESHDAQRNVYVPVHRLSGSGASQASTAPTSVASSPREGQKDLPCGTFGLSFLLSSQALMPL